MASHQPLIMFDGDCGLCDSWVGFVLRRDVSGIFRFTPLQSDRSRSVLRDAGLPDEALDSISLYENGVVYQRSTAVLRILRRLPAPWRWTTALMLIPRPVRDRCYDFVARHRYAWFGRSDSCRLPSPAERARFI